MMEKYDLHCHSYFSDGELSPQALLALAHENNVTHLALTDHDTTAGLALAHQSAKQYGIKLIDGVEISCQWNGRLLHVVALGFDKDNTDLQQGLLLNQQKREQRADAILQQFAKKGIFLSQTLHELCQHKHTVFTRPHFAQALVNQGYVKNKQQAFKRYLAKGKPAYVAVQWPDLAQVAQWIHGAKGYSILAHPTRYKLKRSQLRELLAKMQEYRMHAIEVSTPITTDKERVMLSKLAVEYKLYASIGSDFHHREQTWARLGSAKPLSETVTPIWQATEYAK